MAEDSNRNGELPVTSTPLTTEQFASRPAHWFKPGQTGNPYGNTAPLRSFAAHIRHQTGMGREIAAFYLAIMRGEPIKMPGKILRRGRNGRKLLVSYVRPTLDQRIDAAAWLADRGWGKAKETIELTGEASPAQRLELLRRLSEPEREQLRGLLQRALEAQNGNATPDTIPAQTLGADVVEPVLEPPADPT